MEKPPYRIAGGFSFIMSLDIQILVNLLTRQLSYLPSY